MDLHLIHRRVYKLQKTPQREINIPKILIQRLFKEYMLTLAQKSGMVETITDAGVDSTIVKP